MTEYTFVLDQSIDRPRLMKQVVEDGSVRMLVNVSPSDTADLAEVPRDLYVQHMENLLSYIKDAVENSSIPDPSVRVNTIWPVVGWDDIHSCLVELSDFWYWLNLNTEPATIEE